MGVRGLSSQSTSFRGNSAGGGSDYAKSDAGQSEAGGDLADEDQGLLPRQATAEDAINGVLYTLSKEKASSSFRTSILKLFVDFAQLIVFYVDPAFGWRFSTASAYDVLYNFQLQNPVKDFGFMAWFVIFCLLATVLCGSVGLCAYVAQNFKTGRFPHVWPIKLLRFIIAIFFTLFYVSALGVFILAFDCDFSVGAAEAMNRMFPTRKCLDGIMLPAGVVGMLLSVTFTVIAFFMEQAESDQNPLFTDPLGQPSSAVNVRNMIGKTIISVLWVVLVDTSRGLLAFVMFVITSFMFLDVVAFLPYYYRLTNYVRGGLYAILTWFSLLNLLMVYRETYVENNAVIFWVGTPAALVLGLAAMYARMRHIERIQTLFLVHAREALAKDMDTKVESIVADIDHEFWYPHEVELVSRLIRAKLKYQTRRRSRKVQLAKGEEMALHLASQAALLIGLEQFPEETYLHILYGNFLICISKDSALGYSYLERARGLKTTFEERLMIFTKDRERTQQLGDDSGATKMDLVRYVEFQNSFSLIKKTHQLVLKSTQRFWRLLLRSNVSFGALSKAFKEMDTAESKGDRTYKVMIERYPRSSKLLRCYGYFLEDVRNDPWRAQRYFTEADKIEEDESYEVDSDSDTDGLPTELSNIDDKKYAVMVIKPNGIIRMANEKISKLFGYTKSGELIGKNVNILMPQPYSQQHNGYLKKYMATGKQSIMDVKQRLQGCHKKGHVFPINLLVSKVPGGPAPDDVNFMGIVTARKDDEGVGIIHINKNGIINAFNVACEDIFGCSSYEAPGKPFKKLLAKASVKDFEAAMGLAMATVGSVVERQLQATTKVGRTFPVSLTLVADPSGSIIAKIESLDDVIGMITIDEVGKIRNANEYVVQMFGHSADDLTDMNVSQLMPRPYSTFHASYLKRYKSTKKSKFVGDPIGRVVSGLHKSGHAFPINLQVYTIENASGSDEVLFSGRITLPKSNVDDARSARCTIRADGGILQMAEHFEALYGVRPHALAGRPIEDLLKELEPTEAGLVAAINALQPLEIGRLTRQMSRQSSIGQVSSENETVSKLENLDGAKQHDQPCGLSTRGLLGCYGTPILVFLTTEATSVPHTIVVRVWAGHLMEGVIDITKGGVVSRADFGVQLLFGYWDHDLVGQKVSMLLPESITRHHDKFPQDYRDGGRRKAVGVRRVVDGKHRDGSALRIALELCNTDEGSEVSAYRGEKAAFTARVVLSNESVTATPPEVNVDEHKDATPHAGGGRGGGDTFVPEPRAFHPHDSSKDNSLSTLVEGDVNESPPVTSTRLMVSAGPVTEATEGGGGCPFMASRCTGSLPLALQSQLRDGGGGCPFMATETVNADEADVFLRAQGCDFSNNPAPPTPTSGPRPVCESADDADPAGTVAVDPRALAAAAAAAASPAPSSAARSGTRRAQSKLIRFLTPKQLQAMDEAEHQAGIVDPTEEEAAYFQQQQMYESGGYDGFSAQPGKPDEDNEYQGNGAGASINPTNPGVVSTQEEGGRGQLPRQASGNLSDQSIDAEEEAAETLEKRKAKMRKEVTKAKKARQISKLISSPEVRRAMDRLKSHTKYVLAVLTALYITSFTTMQVLASQHRVVMAKVETGSLMAAAVPLAAIGARVLGAAHSGVINVSTVGVTAELLRQGDIVEDLGRRLYLGEGGLEPPRPRVKQLFEAKDFVVEEWIDADPVRFELVNTSLWDAVSMYYHYIRRVVQNAELGLDMTNNREWRYLIRNGVERLSPAFDQLLISQSAEAVDDKHDIEVVVITLLTLNIALFVTFLSHFWYLLHKVSDERLGLYTVFVSIPRPIVMKLATKKLTMGDDDGDSDSSDDEDAAVAQLKKEQRQYDALANIQAGTGAGVGSLSGGILASSSKLRRSSLGKGGVSSHGSGDNMTNNVQPRPLEDSPPSRRGPATGILKLSKDDFSLRGGWFKAVSTLQVIRWVGMRATTGHGGNQVAPAHQEQVKGISATKYAKTGRKIDRKGSNLNTFLIPLVMWGCISVVSLSLSYWQFEETETPTKDMAVAARVEVLASTARFYANDLVLVGSHGHLKLGNRTDEEEVEHLRVRLRNTTEEMFGLYENLLLGGGKYGLDGSLYTSAEHEPLLFDHTCMRLAAEHHAPPCVELGHEYYYQTMFGLDNLVKVYREECLLLALEPRATLTPNNTRYRFVWEAGKYDLRGGLRTNTHLYKALPASDQPFQICFFVLILMAEAYFVRYLFLPWWGSQC